MPFLEFERDELCPGRKGVGKDNPSSSSSSCSSSSSSPHHDITDLPRSVLILIAEKLITLSNGSARDVIKLALAHSTFWTFMSDCSLTASIWTAQCHRLGWASKWETRILGWNYFCGRMQFRWKLRQKLRQYCSFLDARSLNAVRAGASVMYLQEIESRMKSCLPWGLFELWRWGDGQDIDRGVQFINGARLLSSAESLEIGHWLDTRHLIPFTDELRGRKRYCMDLKGQVWLSSGFNTLHVADSLCDLLHKTLI